MRVKVIIEVYDGATPIRTEVACFEREALSIASCGLTMSEAKALLTNVQQSMVSAQARSCLQAQQSCPTCGTTRSCKENASIVIRTLFGKLRLPSPRYRTCACQKAEATKQSFSPIALALPERTTPELRYLQCKWSALMSLGLTAQLLNDVLPLDKPVSTAVLSRQVQRTAERSESELGSEKELFGAGNPQTWAALAHPAPPLTVGIDGGWVHGREGKNRKAGSFELIVGKSIPQAGPIRPFGFVNGYDQKPRRRLYEVLQGQETQPNQQVIFLSDGGDTVRNLQMYLHPVAEHLLDWFYIVLRVRVLGQLARGLSTRMATKAHEEGWQKDDAAALNYEDLSKQVEQIKWYIWHGNVFSALKNRAECGAGASAIGATAANTAVAQEATGIQRLYHS